MSLSTDGKTVGINGTGVFCGGTRSTKLYGRKSYDLSAFNGTTWLTKSGDFQPLVWTGDTQTALFIDHNGTSVMALNLTTGATNQITQTSEQIYNLNFYSHKS